MNAINSTRSAVVAAAVLAVFWAAEATAFEGPHHILINQNYDSDTVGQMPSVWTGLPLVNNNAFVSNNVSQSAPNSFANQFTSSDSTYTILTVSPMKFTLTNVGYWISYQFDVNVDYIGGNDSEGFWFRLWNSDYSQIDVGAPRLLRNGAQWRFYNPLFPLNGGSSYAGNFNFDEWYTFRVKIVLDGTSGPVANPYFGRAFWYVNNSLINTETWTNRTFNQVRELDTFDIRPVIGTVTGARIYLDNLEVEALPEPTATVFLALGAGLLMRWPRRA